MGIRCTQIVGLKDIAHAFIAENCLRTPLLVCKCGEVITTTYKKEKYADSNSGMFDDGPALHKFFLKDGSTVKEITQDAPWSSGPVIFLCLEKEDGTRMFEWSKEEINANL